VKFIINFLGIKKIVILSIILFAIILSDLFGIFLIYPFINIIQKGNVEINQIIQNKYTYLSFNYKFVKDNIILFILFIFISIFIIKLIISIYLSKIQHKLISKLTYDLSRTMYDRILNVSYSAFQKHPASQLMGIVFNNPIHASIFLNSVATIFSDLLFIIFILLISFYFAKKITLLILLFILIISTIFYFLFIKKLQNLVTKQSEIDNHQHKISFATISAIKDIKIMGIEKLLSKQHEKIVSFFYKSTWNYNLINSALKYSFETIILLSITFLIFFLKDINLNNSSTLPTAIIILGVAFRLLPSYNRMISAFQNIKFYNPVIKKIENYFNETQKLQIILVDKFLNFNKEIELKNITFSYHNKDILNNISLKIYKGQTIGIVGKSGSGKTTLLDIISGLQEKKSGSIFLDGIEIDPFKTNTTRNLIGYVPQNVTLVDESIRFNITFDSDDNYDQIRFKNAIKSSNLSNFINNLSEGDLTKVGENGINISGGQKQRIGIARALYKNPEIIIFDESTSSLDNITESELINEIYNLGKLKTIIIVAHRISTIESCDNIFVIENGNIVGNGSYNYLIKNNKTFMALNLKENI
jgi:ABC-type bacteriocin/lantibiotic exporter with double-glycine peptidase domain